MDRPLIVESDLLSFTLCSGRKHLVESGGELYVMDRYFQSEKEKKSIASALPNQVLEFP